MSHPSLPPNMSLPSLRPKVAVSAVRPAGVANWLLLEPGFMSVISRHYFEDAAPAALLPGRAVCFLASRSDIKKVSIDLVPAAALPPAPTFVLVVLALALLPPPAPTDPTCTLVTLVTLVTHPSDSLASQRLTWISTFVKEHSFARPPFDPASSPPWFSFVPNAIGVPAMHQRVHGSKTGGLGADDIAYSAGPCPSTVFSHIPLMLVHVNAPFPRPLLPLLPGPYFPPASLPSLVRVFRLLVPWFFFTF
jgi:hypothetical protein